MFSVPPPYVKNQVALEFLFSKSTNEFSVSFSDMFSPKGNFVLFGNFNLVRRSLLCHYR